jgi:long-subunit fatty acid transport protein
MNITQSDYGVVAGYEYIFPLGNQLALGTGFQTKYGLNNIFSGNEIIPDYLNSTRNASVNIILSIRYNIK